MLLKYESVRVENKKEVNLPSTFVVLKSNFSNYKDLKSNQLRVLFKESSVREVHHIICDY